MATVKVIKITPTPLNCAAQFLMVLSEPSNVVNFYLTNADSSVKYEYDYPHARIEKTGELNYQFTAPRITTEGIWRCEWLTDFGSSDVGGILFRVRPIVSARLAEDVANWTDGEPLELSPGTLPAYLPMTL